MFAHIINSLAPVFLVIGLGAALRATGFLSESFFRGMNRLVFWVALPVLLFHKIAVAEFRGGPAMKVFVVLAAGAAVCIAAAYLLALLLKVPWTARGAYAQAAFRGNLAYVGLPVILYAVGGGGEIEAIAVLALAPLVPLYQLAAVLVLLVHAEGPRRPSVGQVAGKTAGNPLLVACVLGGGFAWMGWALPDWADRSCGAVGQMALPLALLAIGASLTPDRVKGSLLHSISVSAVKVALAPAAGYVVAVWLGISGDALKIAMIYLACPTAVASYVMAEQLGGDDALAGSAVVISTLMALVSLSLVVALF